MIKQYIDMLVDTGLCSTKSEVLSHFQALGINTNCHDDLVQFKYDLLSVNWNNPITHYCRGTILSIVESETSLIRVKTVAVGFQKFFNWNESFSKYKTDSEFEKIRANIELSQKADGTCILLYYHNGWRCSTLGSIPTGTFGDSDKTFSEMFWELFDIPLKELCVGATYIFELCHEDNQIVTKYDSNRLYYLGSLNCDDTRFNVYRDWRVLSMIKNKECSVKQPVIVTLDPSIRTWEDFGFFVEKHFREGMGKNPEGVVGSLYGRPIFKWKFSDYCLLHKTMTGDDKYVKKSLIERIFKGTLDDIESDLTTSQKEFCSRVKDVLCEIIREYVELVTNLSKQRLETPKDYAFAVDTLISTAKHKEFKGYLYARRTDSISLFDWLQQKMGDHPRYMKFVDMFKLV